MKNKLFIPGRTTIHCFFSCFAILLISGCTPKSKEDNAGFTTEDATVVRDEVLDSLSNSEINEQLLSSGEPFHPELVNKLENVKRYIVPDNTAPAAANLGVYMSDLGYLVEYESSEARSYFFACLQLSSHAGVNKQFGDAIGLRFNEIITGNESLEQSMDYLFKNASNEVEGEGFRKVHAAALSGFYFEELYHLVSVVKLYENKVETDTSAVLVKSVLRTLLGQKKGIDNLVRYFDHVQLQSKGIALYQDLLKLQASYQALETDRMLMEPDNAIVMQDKKLKEAMDLIISIRSGIIWG